jgi:hypothetical protein
MGETVPSFRIVLEEEKAEWKPFRAALNKSDKKDFDDMWDVPRLYITACSNAVSLVPLHPIFISILFHHYKQLKECIAQVEQMSSNVEGLQKAYSLQQLKLSDFQSLGGDAEIKKALQNTHL